jgi:hypothetical protein
VSRSIDRITLQERADWSVYESTGITFDNMAFGQTGLRDYGDTAADTQPHRIRQRLGGGTRSVISVP